MVDVLVRDVEDWDGRKYESHVVAGKLREILEKEFVDPKHSIKVDSDWMN